uniref:Uncharacterized protein n=1 Tax=Romanomermis culicivorax TaxID=13658 RepID=A0A915KE49_ROMCU
MLLIEIKGEMRKIWAYKVDQSATVLKDRKIFEADTTLLSCPPGSRPKAPRRNLKPDKWYVICSESSCESCFLDRMKNSVKWDETEYAKLDHAAI